MIQLLGLAEESTVKPPLKRERDIDLLLPVKIQVFSLKQEYDSIGIRTSYTASLKVKEPIGLPS